MQMMQQFDKLFTKGKPFAEYMVFIVGPSCIAKEYRWLGIYPQIDFRHYLIFLKDTQKNPSRLKSLCFRIKSKVIKYAEKKNWL